MAGQDGDPYKPPPADRPGLPDPHTVVSEKTVTSPKGKTFRILETTERDEYDPPEPPGEDSSEAAGSKRLPDGED